MIIHLVFGTQSKKDKDFLISKLIFLILFDKLVYKIPILSCDVIYMILNRSNILKLYKFLLDK